MPKLLCNRCTLPFYFLGVLPSISALCAMSNSAKKKTTAMREVRALRSPALPINADACFSTGLCLAHTLIFLPAAGSEHACLPQLRPRKCNRALVCCCSSKTAHLFASQMRGIASSARVQTQTARCNGKANYLRPVFHAPPFQALVGVEKYETGIQPDDHPPFSFCAVLSCTCSPHVMGRLLR